MSYSRVEMKPLAAISVISEAVYITCICCQYWFRFAFVGDRSRAALHSSDLLAHASGVFCCNLRTCTIR